MKAKALILTGVALLVMTLDASAQRRGRGVTNAGFGIVTPFGNIGNPYPYGTGYGYNNGYNNPGFNNFGNNRYGYNNQYGYNRFNQPTYVVPAQNSSFYTPQTTVVTPQTTVVPTTVTQASGTQPTTSGRTGLMITEVKDDSPAKDAGLRRGDVILSVDAQRTQNFDELRSVLKNTDKKQVSVEFIDGSNGKVETKKVSVKDAKFGVSIEETPVNQ